jgi:hypothetical protein
MLPELIDQIPADQEIASITADGAFDTRRCHDAIAARGAAAIIPPRRNGKPWKPDTSGARGIVLGPCMDGSRVARGAMIFWLLVGCGHVFGVSFAVCLRALMNVRVRSGPYQWHALEALWSERGVPSSFPSVCHHLTLPSPFRSGRLRPEVQSGHAARQSAPVLSIAQTARTMRLASAMAATLSGFLAIMPPSQPVPGSDFLRPEMTDMAPR